MSGAKQAPVRGKALALHVLQRCVAPAAVILLAGCSVSALDPGAPDVDRSVVTGSIAPVPMPENFMSQSVKPAPLPTGTDAMLHAMVGGMGASLYGAPPLSWDDPENDVRGVVTAIFDDETGTCRRFVTSRESFDGVGLYRGTVCPTPEFGWQIQAFEAV